MSEDSWSGSDSSSDSGSGGSSGSSDDSSSGNAWATAAGEILGNALNDLTETRPATQTAGPSSGSGGALLNPALQALFLAGSGKPATDQRSLVRRIVEAPCWYVTTGVDGSLKVTSVTSADDQLKDACTLRLRRGDPQRKWAPPRGQSARLLRVRSEQPARPHLELSGYELVRRLPLDIDGILLMHDEQHGLGLGLWRDELKLLTQLADAHDLEQILLHPAPGQLSALRTARWYLPAGKRKFKTVLWAFDELIRVCTHPDGGYEDDHPMQELSGAMLFEQLAARDGFDGIAVVVGLASDYQKEDIRFGPGVLRGVAAGVDTRLCAEPLPARTRAEIDLWMEITQFPWKDREIVPVDEPPGAVQVRSSMRSRWRPYETSVGAPERPAPTLGPVFTIEQPDARPGDLGEGQTAILCAGLLAQYLYDKGSWHPSRWFVSKNERIRAARLASIAIKLEKLLPDGRDQLPRRAILSVDGASFLRRRPEYRSRSWIAGMRARHHKTATHWLPSLR